MVEVDPQKMLAKYGVTGQAAAILMIIFGILVIVFTNLLPFLIGAYLIIVGIINLIGHTQSGQTQPARAPLARPAKRQWTKYK